MRISDWSSDVCSSDLLGSLVSKDIAVIINWLGRYQNENPRQKFLVGRSGILTHRVRNNTGFQWPPHRHASRRLLSVPVTNRSEEHTSELQSLMRISYAVFCLKKKKTKINNTQLIHKNETHYNKKTMQHQDHN